VDDEYKAFLEDNIKRLQALGVTPCEKHAWQSMNADGTCETCKKEDFPEDFQDTE
jgi:hypothetical protein